MARVLCEFIRLLFGHRELLTHPALADLLALSSSDSLLQGRHSISMTYLDALRYLSVLYRLCRLLLSVGHQSLTETTTPQLVCLPTGSLHTQKP